MKNFLYKIERFLLRILNKIFYNGKRAPKRIELMSAEELNDFVYHGLIDNQPFMVARFGSIELDSALYTYLCELPLLERYKLYIQKKIPFLRYSEDYAKHLMNPLCNNAGFFPNNVDYLAKFGKKVREEDSSCCCCCCCCWNNEDLMIPFFDKNIVFGELAKLEPYDYFNPWTIALKGKNVLVVHPFADTIRKQYNRRKFLWKNHDILPDFNLFTIKAVQSIAGEKTSFVDWFEALHYMENQMDSIDYDIAIIGCGAYGFSLAAHAKRSGKKAVHLGGATQILFGIKGKRWDNIPAVSKYYNEYWVNPSIEETPKNNTLVEGGCYW